MIRRYTGAPYCVGMKRNPSIMPSELLWNERILPRITPTDGCWNWPGATVETGYGKVCFRIVNKRHVRMVHRIAMEIKIGRPLMHSECALHRCDNRLCFNPEHLFLGTRKDNNKDRMLKGRNADMRGDKNPKCNTNKEIVTAVLLDAANGISQRDMAKKHRLSKGAIWNIINGRHWLTK